MSVPGWGGLEERVQERQRETMQGLDANGTIQLGKLLPEKLGVTLPMYLGYSNQTSTPQFDPLSPDVEATDLAAIADLIDNPDDLDAIGSRQRDARTINQVRSINFSNVKIAPQVGKGGGSKDRNSRGKDDVGKGKDSRDAGGRDAGGKNAGSRGGAQGGRGGSNSSGGGLLSVISPANFSANYSYNEQYRQDIYTDNFRNVEHRGALNYNWQPRPKKRHENAV